MMTKFQILDFFFQICELFFPKIDQFSSQIHELFRKLAICFWKLLNFFIKLTNFVSKSMFFFKFVNFFSQINELSFKIDKLILIFWWTFFKINKRKEKQNNIKTHVKTEEKTSPVEKENQSLFSVLYLTHYKRWKKKNLDHDQQRCSSRRDGSI